VLLRHPIQGWQDRAAVRAELTLEPTRRRRIDRLPQRLGDRLALRAERRARPHDFGRALDDATSRAWAVGWPVEKRRG
jgi:hypothetical protein